MSEPEKNELPKEPEKLERLNDMAETAANKFRDAARKGVGFFKKTKAALEGDENAQNDLAEGAARTLGKISDTLEKVDQLGEKLEKKIEDKIRNRKP